MWAGAELRRRWASLVVLGVLGGLAAGLAIAAYDGAQRSGSAYVRMQSAQLAADTVVFPSQAEIYDFDPRLLDDIDVVEAWGGFSLAAGSIDGLPPFATPFITSGDDWFDTIERATVLQGRLPDPTSEHEVVITEPVLDDDFPQVRVGSHLTWRTLSIDEAIAFEGDAPPDFDWTTSNGVVTEIEIVGVVRLPIESVAAFANDGMMLTSPAWAHAHFDDTPIYFTNAVVRVSERPGSLDRLADGVARLGGRDDIPIKDLDTDVKRVQRSLDVERVALLMFSLAIALTAIVLVGQAIVRATAAGGADVVAMRAMGASNVALVAGLTFPMLIVVGVTLVATTIVGVLATHWFPIGLARRLEPDPGVHVAPGPLVGGLVITTTCVVVTVVVTALATQRPNRIRRHVRTTAMSWVTRSGAGVPPAVGTSLALDGVPERGPRSRLAVVAAVAGVMAVVAALTLVHAIDDIAEHPERAGATWDLEMSTIGFGLDEIGRAADAEPAVESMALMGRLPTRIAGADAAVYALDVRKGDVAFTVVQGEAPGDDDEIALGPATARLIDAGIGDTVGVGPDQVPMEVVGISLLSQTPHSAFDEGGWVTVAAYETMATPFDFDGKLYEAALLVAAPGVSSDVLAGDLPSHWGLVAPAESADVHNLVKVRELPIYLAGFLALLALGAVAHALFTAVRQRARDLAVLQALGLTARQAASSVSWQATVTGSLAAAIGIPLGALLGRRVWRAISDELSFVYVGPLPAQLLVLSAPVCLALCMLLAVHPARGTAKRPITEALREE
jgi:ABC-type lipoprotein release transport system permease subunit